MRYLGIDPGVSGGIATVDVRGAVERFTKMPETEQDLLALLRAEASVHERDPNCERHEYLMADGHCTCGRGKVRAVLEYVRASPQMGVVSAFSFGKGYGGLRMALVACNIPFDEVTPQKWQAAMQCRTKGDKNVSKRRAQELFPSVKVTHAIADALLLAEYARRLELRC